MFNIPFLVGGLAQVRGPGPAYDANTLLMCHFDGTNESTTITDAVGRHTLTAVGDAQISTAESKFAQNLLLDGTGDYVSAATSTDWDLSAANSFTIDFWIYPVALANNGLIMRSAGNLTSSTDFYFCYQQGGVKWYVGGPNGGQWNSSAGNLATGSWQHVALVYNAANNYLTIYRNGMQEAQNTSVTSWNNPTGNPLYLFGGRNIDFLNGRVDELRWSNVARWTANFLPPTRAYPNPYYYDEYTALMLHMDGINGSTTITDSAQRHTLTAVGDAKISTAQGKFGQSLLLDGNGDYVTVPASSDFVFGTGNFTVDLWVRTAVNEDRYSIVTNRAGAPSNNHWSLHVYSDVGRPVFHTGLTALLLSSTALTQNTWQHLAVVRNSGTTKMYLDGNEVASALDSFDYSQQNQVNIGHDANFTAYSDLGATPYFNGHIDELRVSKGIARWTANFTPPTAPYS